jgi:hypothetical protein
MIALSAGKALEPSGCAGNLRLAGHECRATQHPSQTEELLARWRCLTGHEMLEPVKTLSGFEGKEIRGAKWVGHEVES